MKQLIENLRDQYRQHGTNHVQKAADLLEMLIAQRSETIEMTYAQAKTINDLLAERDYWKEQARILKADRYQHAVAMAQHEELVAERDAFKADAERYRWLLGKMQASYDGDEQEMPEDFAVYCNMLSAWRTERTVRAEITWTDTRDEQLGLSGAIDAARAALGETK